ncbi:hypothetical protein [Leucobacter japonicus]|uniref:hypothetical protein n=1 Tax=Leucobacter japonicus TaxID=1461259 RepID=UPI0006A7DB9B|nr:hypothetical protein [Leucobacter japonicus]
MLRYIVERISDGEFLELELPINVSSAGKRLSGPGPFGGTIAPDVGGLRAASGDLLIDQYATFIHEEADGVIRGTWLVVRSSFDAEWKIDGTGFSAYLNGLPYEGEYRGIAVDMADVIRHLWAHAQRFTRTNIGVTVTGMTGVVRGTDSDVKADAAKAQYEAKKATLKVASDNRKAKSAQIKKAAAPFDAQIKVLLEQQKPLKAAYQALIDARKPLIDAHRALTKQRSTRTEVYKALVEQKSPPATPAEIAAAKAAVDALAQPIVDAAAAVNARKAPIEAAKVPLDAKNSQLRVVRANRTLALEPLQLEYEALKLVEEPLKQPTEDAKDAWEAAKEKQSADGGAWKILWWDTPDCGTEVQNCLDEAGWEFVEWSGWNSDRTKILKQIRLQQRVGRTQSALQFVEGDNIIEKVVVETPATDYANAVLAIGAGEGKRALRSTAEVSDGRRRRVHVLDAKNVTKLSVLKVLAERELAWRSRPLRVTDVRVDARHPNAPRGTFDVGDTILIDCEVSWIGRQRLLHRIEEIEWVDDYVADLKLGVSA